MKQLFKNIEFNAQMFRISLVVLAVVCVLQIMADIFDWYYIFPKFDTPMHVLGGMFVGFFALAYTIKGSNPLQKMVWVITWSIIIGVGVEIFEWALTHIFHKEVGFLLQGSVLDTYGDILHDFIGGVISFCIAYFYRYFK